MFSGEQHSADDAYPPQKFMTTEAAEKDKTTPDNGSGGGDDNDTTTTERKRQNLADKHPVTALTEICSQQRWGKPIFDEAWKVGPSHKKRFVFKVTVKGLEYMGSVAMDNKKKAKASAALACLQALGFLEMDPNNPV